VQQKENQTGGKPMCRKIVSVISMVFATAFIAACGESAGSNCPCNSNQSNFNFNQNWNNNNSQGNLTRRIMAETLVGGVIRYDLDSPANPCDTALFPDVDDSPGNIRLCRAITFLYRRFIILQGMPDGLFHPDDEVEWSETWKFTVLAMGYMAFPANPWWNVDPSAWYSPYIGSIGNHGFAYTYPVEPNGFEVRPGAIVKMEEWNVVLGRIDNFHNRAAYRIMTLEVLLMTLSYVPYDPSGMCMPDFEDIYGDDLRCEITQAGVDQGLIDPDQYYFRVYDYVSWPELFVMTRRALSIPEAPGSDCFTGCTDDEDDGWWCPSANALCEAGLLPEHQWVPNIAPMQYEVSAWLFWIQTFGL
jgi:hypothetical protein